MCHGDAADWLKHCRGGDEQPVGGDQMAESGGDHQDFSAAPGPQGVIGGAQACAEEQGGGKDVQGLDQ
ncbi:hypothetical protein D3C76_1512600 [compost metagenome]